MTNVEIKGRVYVVGDHIDTDQIIPAQFLNLVPTIPAEYEKLGSHAFGGLPDDYPDFIKNGTKSEYSIVIAGRNFGCGSSREHAPVALGAAGIKAVVAESYARIFFRNCISTGEFYPCEFMAKKDGSDKLDVSLCDSGNMFCTGDMVEINVEKGFIKNQSNGMQRALQPIGAAAEVIDAGGIFGYARKMGMIKVPVS